MSNVNDTENKAMELNIKTYIVSITTADKDHNQNEAIQDRG